MLDNVGLRYPHRASGAKAPRTLRPLPLLRFAVSATGGAHLCSIQYYLRFWLGICRTSLAVSALRIMRYCLKMMHSTAPRIIQTFIESNDLTEKTCTCSAPPAAAVMTKVCGTCNPCTRISILPPKASPHGWTVLPECSPFPYNLNAKPPTQFCCAGGFVLCLAFLQGCVYNNRAVVLLHRAQLPDSNCLSSSVG